MLLQLPEHFSNLSGSILESFQVALLIEYIRVDGTIFFIYIFKRKIKNLQSLKFHSSCVLASSKLSIAIYVLLRSYLSSRHLTC